MTAQPEEPGILQRLALIRAAAEKLGVATPELRGLLDQAAEEPPVPAGNVRPLGRARKISVSMPEELTAAVQRRVGKGEFSQYVAEAVARQLELDLLGELTELLEAGHGPVPEGLLAEAAAAWPDTE
jgi:Arc/MetJ-type ribon-helix-helix transcriptional regulator